MPCYAWLPSPISSSYEPAVAPTPTALEHPPKVPPYTGSKALCNFPSGFTRQASCALLASSLPQPLGRGRDLKVALFCSLS